MTWPQRRDTARADALARDPVSGFGPMFTVGNRKLGPGMFTWSRPYGESCPATCPLLGGECYANHETRGPFIGSLYLGALNRFGFTPPFRLLPAGAVVRLHVSGDFGRDGAADVPYIAALVAELREAAVTAFTYSHGWREWGPALADLRREMAIMASVETEAEAAEALAAGWKVAIEGPQVDGRHWRVDGYSLPVCPQQLGRVASCSDCGICWAPNGPGVAFIRH